ncbi:SCYL1 [Branchiostoma lanceolatum]|uniref:N-terminal kinase-like protein n=1 Tax=Branchiostoma lanceolatum TaxID=7740 RepID=A0A8J9ZR43_BRALA|nr:SCYL1 [Branchiostoma lanceolatum]
MWSFFSRDPAANFAFEIGDVVPGLEEKSIWTLHKGKRKANGEPVSVFVFDVKDYNETQTDKTVYVVTEPVVPLTTYIAEQKPNELVISWGLHQIVKALSFFVNDVNLIHNNVCSASVFVDPAGEWKLGGVDYMYPATGEGSIPPVKILPALERYDPPEKNDLSRGRKAEKWSSDMWGLGCLIWEVFNGPLPRTSALKALGKIPKSLVPNYCELVGANPKVRPNPANFIQSCRKTGGFMKNSFVDTNLFLEEQQIKDQNEKTKFFSELTPKLDDFPDNFCKHRILPQLLNAYEFGNAGSSVLAPLFKLGRLLDQEDYQKKIVPCVVKLFSSTDRSTRIKLLMQMDLFIEHLQPATINDQIFPQIVHGFMDTNPAIREQTVKAMLLMAPKLNDKNLNTELMKHFARLQSKDDQGGIRTNTTVCLGKIACHLNPQTRQKVLGSAFTRAMKDPFPPARIAGVMAMAANQKYFPLKDAASKALPTLCTLTVDPEKGVRDQAFKAIRCFVDSLEKLSEDPELLANLESEVNSPGTTDSSASGWTGWAVTGVSSLTSKLYRGGNKPAATAPGAQQPTAKAPSAEPTPSQPANAPVSTRQEPEVEVEEEESGDDGGWENDTEEWGSMEDFSVPKAREPVQRSPQLSRTGSTAVKAGPANPEDEIWAELKGAKQAQDTMEDDFGTEETGGWGDDDDAWEDFDVPKKASAPSNPPKLVSSNAWDNEDWGDDITTSSALPPASSYNWGGSGDDPFSAVSHRPCYSSNTKSAKSSSVSRGSSRKQDDWGDVDNSWDSWGSGGSSQSKDDARKQREEKQQQRRQEMERKRAEKKSGKGAMKLGAKKVAVD